MSVDLTKGATVELVKTLSDDLRTKVEGGTPEEGVSAGDILRKKADNDGYFEEMTLGDSEQLVATQYVSDSEPYLFRTTGGSADVGNREYMESIVGGTVAWNQMIEHGNFDSTSYWFYYQCSIAISDGVATVTPTGGISRIYRNVSVVSGHKYLMTASFKGTAGEGNATLSWYGSNNVFVPFTGNWQRVSKVLDNTFGTANKWQVYYGSNGNANMVEYQIKEAMCFDLTQMFGSTIADYIYSLEQSTAGAGVAWFKKLFPLDYYPYDAGTLKHVEGLTSHDTVGFNQWDEEWEVGGLTNTGVPTSASNRIRSKNFCQILPNTTYFDTCGKTDGGNQNIYYLAIFFYDANKDFISYVWSNNRTFTTPSNAAYFKVTTNSSTVVYGSTYNHDICINLSWSGWRNGEYEPYHKHSYPLDSSLVLRGIPKLDAQNNLYFDGDVYNHDGTVERRYGIVDLGTLNWQYITMRDHNYFRTVLTPARLANTALACSYYAYGGQKYDSEMLSADIGVYTPYNSGMVYVKDTAYTDATAFKTAISGVMLVYELATPTTEEAEPFQEVQICDDFGTEEFVTPSIVPVGHNTEYPANLRDKLQHLPNLADADGYYMIKQVDKQMSLEHFRIPKAPETDGTYTLKATVSGGTPTYTWESESEAVENG